MSELENQEAGEQRREHRRAPREADVQAAQADQAARNMSHEGFSVPLSSSVTEKPAGRIARIDEASDTNRGTQRASDNAILLQKSDGEKKSAKGLPNVQIDTSSIKGKSAAVAELATPTPSSFKSLEFESKSSNAAISKTLIANSRDEGATKIADGHAAIVLPEDSTKYEKVGGTAKADITGLKQVEQASPKYAESQSKMDASQYSFKESAKELSNHFEQSKAHLAVSEAAGSAKALTNNELKSELSAMSTSGMSGKSDLANKSEALMQTGSANDSLKRAFDRPENLEKTAFADAKVASSETLGRALDSKSAQTQLDSKLDGRIDSRYSESKVDTRGNDLRGLPGERQTADSASRASGDLQRSTEPRSTEPRSTEPRGIEARSTESRGTEARSPEPTARSVADPARPTPSDSPTPASSSARAISTETAKNEPTVKQTEARAEFSSKSQNDEVKKSSGELAVNTRESSRSENKEKDRNDDQSEHLSRMSAQTAAVAAAAAAANAATLAATRDAARPQEQIRQEQSLARSSSASLSLNDLTIQGLKQSDKTVSGNASLPSAGNSSPAATGDLKTSESRSSGANTGAISDKQTGATFANGDILPSRNARSENNALASKTDGVITSSKAEQTASASVGKTDGSANVKMNERAIEASVKMDQAGPKCDTSLTGQMKNCDGSATTKDYRPDSMKDAHAPNAKGTASENTKELTPFQTDVSDLDDGLKIDANGKIIGRRLNSENKRYLTGIELSIAALLTVAGAAKLRDQKAGAEVDNELADLNEVLSANEEEDSKVFIRRTYMVQEGDTLLSIAEELYSNRAAAWLIADLNIANIKEAWIDGKRVVELQARQIIELPESAELTQFLSKQRRDFNPDKIITVVTANTVDRELLQAFLGTVSGDIAEPSKDPKGTVRVAASASPAEALPDLTIEGLEQNSNKFPPASGLGAVITDIASIIKHGLKRPSRDLGGAVS